MSYRVYARDRYVGVVSYCLGHGESLSQIETHPRNLEGKTRVRYVVSISFSV